MLSRIELLNLEEDELRLEVCRTMLESQGMPPEVLHIEHHPKVIDFPTIGDFLDFAAQRFPEFGRLSDEIRYYLSNLYGHLLKLDTLAQMDEGELGMVMEDDWLLNVNYDELCRLIAELYGHCCEREHPFMLQLKTWGNAEEFDSSRDTGVLGLPLTAALETATFPHTCYYATEGLGIWANVFDKHAAALFRDCVLEDMVWGYQDFGKLLKSLQGGVICEEVAGDQFAIDIYVYAFMRKFPCYSVKPETEFFLQNVRTVSYHVNYCKDGLPT